MPVCANCGEFNPPNTARCGKCGVSLAHQVRSLEAASRNRNVSFVKIAVWIAALIVLIVVGPGIYHTVYGKYLDFRLDSAKRNAIKYCEGPVTDTTPAYDRERIEKCIATDPALLSAQNDWNAFNKAAKH